MSIEKLLNFYVQTNIDGLIIMIEMKIKVKILAGFFLIIAMLIVAGAMSIYDFSRLSDSVRALIDDNYKTIEACKSMIEALEREDSGILLLVSGEWREGREILDSADALFLSAFEVASNNLTEPGEEEFIERIDSCYKNFKGEWELPIVGTSKENSIGWYYTDLYPSFTATVNEVKALMNLNQDSMYQESVNLKEKSRRAIMPGIVAIAAALVFLMILNYFVSKFFVNPVHNLVRALKNYSNQSQKFDAGISSDDEMKDLETEIMNLIIRLRQKGN